MKVPFQAVMDERGWDTPDIVMEDRQTALDTRSPRMLYLPLILR